jgi:putative iron-dependent peroxidase
MASWQPGILADVPPLACYHTYTIQDPLRAKTCAPALRDLADGDGAVMGVGLSLVRALAKEIPGLRNFPVPAGAIVEIPSTPAALWFWLRGDDRGELVHRGRKITKLLAPAFRLSDSIDAFRYQSGLDMTGYEDGTENPRDEAAVEAALVQGSGAGLDGSSFVAVQRWVHDLDRFDRLPDAEHDNTIGRRKRDNAEIASAPASAHIKRTAQESFQPEAFILRRSMPWAAGLEAGLVFVAFGKSFTAFESLLNRMTGVEDGVIDALFSFTRPISGSYFWCPPLHRGRPDLSILGI